MWHKLALAVVAAGGLFLQGPAPDKTPKAAPTLEARVRRLEREVRSLRAGLELQAAALSQAVGAPEPAILP